LRAQAGRFSRCYLLANEPRPWEWLEAKVSLAFASAQWQRTVIVCRRKTEGQGG
jgi:hypothetical protein